jgi:methylated-DNA-[protein]-cysteine S-methyltransferase
MAVRADSFGTDGPRPLLPSRTYLGVTAGRGPSVSGDCSRVGRNPTCKSMANAQFHRHRNMMAAMNPRSLNADAPRELTVDRFDTPVGAMYAVTDDASRLRAFAWVDHEARGILQLRQQYGSGISVHDGAAPLAIRKAFDRYFEGDLHAIDEIECATNGTPFQQSVWNALRGIPVGATLSYGALALRIGKPNAVRAVGLANGSNPIALVLPCHRVIGTDGSLTGYGGGLDRKRWLLAHEGAKGVFGNAPASLF